MMNLNCPPPATKKWSLTAFAFIIMTYPVFAQQTFYDVTAGNGNGIRFWQDHSYKIHMGTGSEYFFGPVQDYSIKMNMSGGTPNRGWTWGIAGQTPVAAINTLGTMQIAGNFIASSNVGIGTTSPQGKLDINSGSTYAIRTATTQRYVIEVKNSGDGTGGWWFANDPNGNFVLHRNNVGDKLTVNGSGNLGIGTTAPYAWSRLHIKAPGLDPWGILAEANTSDKVIGISHDGTNGVIAVSYLGTGGWSPLQFRTQNLTRMAIDVNGNVGIGTTNPNQKLTVNGTIYGKEVKVDLSVPGPDYVFDKDYKLTSLEDIKTYIDQHKHLPEVPSAAAMEANGINLSEMNMILLKKIEELTLYVIELKKENEKQNVIIDSVINNKDK